MVHEERFPPTRLSAGCGFRKGTIASMRRNGRDAPVPDLPALATERGGPTLSGRSGQRREVVGCSGNAETDLWRSNLLPAAYPNRSYHQLDAERRRISSRSELSRAPHRVVIASTYRQRYHFL